MNKGFLFNLIYLCNIIDNSVYSVPVILLHICLQSLSFASICRNNMFIYLHILIEAAVLAEFTYEVFGFCRDMDTSLISLSVPYILLVIKSLCFYLCIRRDPGSYYTSFHMRQTREVNPGVLRCDILRTRISNTFVVYIASIIVH